jgi:hypothetical protein
VQGYGRAISELMVAIASDTLGRSVSGGNLQLKDNLIKNK